MRTKTMLVVGLLVGGMSLGLAACGHEPESAEAPATGTEATAVQATTEAVDLASDEQGDFYMTEITDEIFDRIKGKSFKDDCTLPREDLRYLHVLHTDIDGNVHEGEMIVNYHIAQDVLDILRELYENDYPIERIRLVDEYDADDEMSMRDNNSSSFNFRFISHTNRVSKHGLGLAVDINTLYNPNESSSLPRESRISTARPPSTTRSCRVISVTTCSRSTASSGAESGRTARTTSTSRYQTTR